MGGRGRGSDGRDEERKSLEYAWKRNPMEAERNDCLVETLQRTEKGEIPQVWK